MKTYPLIFVIIIGLIVMVVRCVSQTDIAESDKDKQTAFPDDQKNLAQGLAPSLSEVYKNYFPIGAAVDTGSLYSQEYKDLLLRHFNSVTAENEMKQNRLMNSVGEIYNFTQADIIVDFALQNNIKVRGHTLIWHGSTPGWFFLDDDWREPLERERILKRMEDYIKTVVGRSRYAAEKKLK